LARVAFILLCHKDIDGIIRQAEGLTATGDFVAIHLDRRAPVAEYDRLRAALSGNPNVAFAGKRIKCGWGAWSLVAATLEALETAWTRFPGATHFYMLSGDCMAIKSAEYAHRLLDRENADYIEAFDFFNSDWIRTGIKAERLIYRHWFNEREQKKLFYASMNLQEKLGLRRDPPADLQIMIGSQWWCLRRSTIAKLRDFLRARRDVIRFFRTTWIPDETFFQTIVKHLIPESELRLRTLTFLIFSDYGMPVTFHDDHYDFLLAQDYLFARKISVEALDLRARLSTLWASEQRDFTISGGGQRLYHFLAGRGRVGRRFAPRIWEAESSVGPEREVIIVTSKKWHIGKRMADALSDASGIPRTGYLFNEINSHLPYLGGLESTLEKRTRHRRALVRLLFDHYGTDKLIICVDPNQIDLIRDFYSDRCKVRLLELRCAFSDDYLSGHARRVGLVGGQTPAAIMDSLLPTIRFDFEFEAHQLQDAGFGNYHRIQQWDDPRDATRVLASFMGWTVKTAGAIWTRTNLFRD
jgi:hypothetical protein